MQHRDALELIWRAGVFAVGGHNCVTEALQGKGGYDGILAVGKAATPMLEAALAHAGYDTRSLLVTKYGHVQTRHKFNQDKLEEYQRDGTLQIIEAGHPVPDENSLKAGLALEEFVGDMGAGSRLLVLVSGGASALAELLVEDMSLSQLRAMSDEMLKGGLDIQAINSRRKKNSRIKDGRLLAGFQGKIIDVMAISDVEGDDISTIGSGIGMVESVGENVEANVQIIGSNAIVRNASAAKTKMLGYELVENAEIAYGDVASVGAKISQIVKRGAEGIYIFGGEPTVVLPKNPGRGGRNQHLAVLLAREFAGFENVEFLVAGTDGSDGPGNAAGGFGNGSSFGKVKGGNDALLAADAGSYLEQCGDLFVTGPTGTNVMDMIVLIKS